MSPEFIQELRDQMREGYAAVTGAGGGLSLSTLKDYSKGLVDQYDGMSAEERLARGWTGQFRAKNLAFALAPSSY